MVGSYSAFKIIFSVRFFICNAYKICVCNSVSNIVIYFYYCFFFFYDYYKRNAREMINSRFSRRFQDVPCAHVTITIFVTSGRHIEHNDVCKIYITRKYVHGYLYYHMYTCGVLEIPRPRWEALDKPTGAFILFSRITEYYGRTQPLQGWISRKPCSLHTRNSCDKRTHAA